MKIKCSVCGELNDGSTNFCKSCFQKLDPSNIVDEPTEIISNMNDDDSKTEVLDFTFLTSDVQNNQEFSAIQPEIHEEENVEKPINISTDTSHLINNTPIVKQSINNEVNNIKADDNSTINSENNSKTNDTKSLSSLIGRFIIASIGYGIIFEILIGIVESVTKIIFKYDSLSVLSNNYVMINMIILAVNIIANVLLINIIIKDTFKKIYPDMNAINIFSLLIFFVELLLSSILKISSSDMSISLIIITGIMSCSYALYEFNYIRYTVEKKYSENFINSSLTRIVNIVTIIIIITLFVASLLV